MKTLLNLTFLGLLFLAPTLQAQQAPKQKKGVFVRVLNFEGRKLAKGFIQSVNDEQMVIQRGKRSKTIRIAEIQQLRLKRSVGHKVAVGAGTGLAIGGGLVLAAGTTSSDNAYDDLINVTVPFGSMMGGAAIGGIIGLLSEPTSVQVNGDPVKLKRFYEVMDSY